MSIRNIAFILYYQNRLSRFPKIEQPPTASEAREVIDILLMSPTPMGGHIPSFNFQKGQTVSEALLILRKTITILL